MNPETAKKQVDKLLEKDVQVKLYFNHRTPMFGKFVKHNEDDYNHLWKKKMVRFVSEARREEYELTKNIECAKIYVVTDFKLIAEVKPLSHNSIKTIFHG